MVNPLFRRAALASAAALGLTGSAHAHHGWSWTEAEESRLAGIVEAVSLGNPHAHVTIRNEEGVWEVDLAPPSSTLRSGFVEGVAKPGDRIEFTGHRSREPSERGFKAETVTVGGKTYDVYPNRPKTLQPTGAASQ